jgi:hypothetical protein
MPREHIGSVDGTRYRQTSVDRDDARGDSYRSSSVYGHHDCGP